MSKALEPQHRSHSLFDSAMVLLNGLITNDKFCIIRVLGWVEGFEPAATGTISQSRMLRWRQRASKSVLAAMPISTQSPRFASRLPRASANRVGEEAVAFRVTDWWRTAINRIP